jgi:hypothetical protein
VRDWSSCGAPALLFLYRAVNPLRKRVGANCPLLVARAQRVQQAGELHLNRHERNLHGRLYVPLTVIDSNASVAIAMILRVHVPAFESNS